MNNHTRDAFIDILDQAESLIEDSSAQVRAKAVQKEAIRLVKKRGGIADDLLLKALTRLKEELDFIKEDGRYG